MTHADQRFQPSFPRVDRNQRFWQVPVPLAVIQACAGNALLLTAWVTTAAAIAEDAALRGTPRSIHELIAAVARQSGLHEHDQAQAIATGLLIQLEQLKLLVVIDGQVALPSVALAEASLHEAQRLLVDAERHAAAAAVTHRQGALPGFAD